MSREWLMFVLLCLTCYRITRLIVSDTVPIVRVPREKFLGVNGDKLDGTKIEWLGELLGCHWCVSVWIAGALVVVAQIATGDVPYPLLAWPSVAAVGALIAHREDGPVS